MPKSENKPTGETLIREELPPHRRTEIHFYRERHLRTHTHAYYELILFTQGKIRHTLNGKTDVLTKKQVAILRPGDVHNMSAYKNYDSQHLNVSVDESEFIALASGVGEHFFSYLRNANEPLYARLTDKEFDYILYLTDKINTLPPQKTDEQSALLIKQLTFNLLVPFFPCREAEETERPAWLDEFLQKLSLPEFFTKPLSELYAHAPYSQSVLNRYFQEYIGQTMVRYVTEQKINYARNLLQNTDFPIRHVAKLLAYESPAHFNRTFKKATGKTPSEYRLHFSEKNR